MQNTLRSALPDLILLRRKFATRGITGKGGDQAQAPRHPRGGRYLKHRPPPGTSASAARRSAAAPQDRPPSVQVPLPLPGPRDDIGSDLTGHGHGQQARSGTEFMPAGVQQQRAGSPQMTQAAAAGARRRWELSFPRRLGHPARRADAFCQHL